MRKGWQRNEVLVCPGAARSYDGFFKTSSDYAKQGRHVLNISVQPVMSLVGGAPKEFLLADTIIFLTILIERTGFFRPLLRILYFCINYFIMQMLIRSLFIALSFLFCCSLPAISQSNTQQVKQTVQQFFEALNQKNTQQLVFHVQDTSTLLLKSVIYSKKEEQYKEIALPFTEFLKGIDKAKQNDSKWEEKIWSMDINIDGGMATVWTPYSFFVDNELSHCGTNHLLLIKQETSWKITGLTDTRRRKTCRMTESDDAKALINKSIDIWHDLAANADMKYFDFMTPNAIYIGTDAKERWTKQEFLTFAKPHFDKGKAWSFKTINRNVYLSKDEKTAWFEELLDTWMGPCRASGVLELTEKGWLLSHYQLSVTVPNEKIKEFLNLIEKQ